MRKGIKLRALKDRSYCLSTPWEGLYRGITLHRNQKTPSDPGSAEKGKDQCDLREQLNIKMGLNITSKLISSAPQTNQEVTSPTRQ